MKWTSPSIQSLALSEAARGRAGRGGDRLPADGRDAAAPASRRGLRPALRRLDVDARAVADRGHAVAPGEQPRIGIRTRAAVDVAAAKEPDDVIGREIGDAGRVAQQVWPAVRQHVGDPFDLWSHELKVAERRLAHRLDRRQRQAVQPGAVGVQSLGHVVGIDARHVERGGPHELLLGPPGDGFAAPDVFDGKEGRLRHAPFQLARDQSACRTRDRRRPAAPGVRR